jgi:hypothetical protein
MKTYTVIYLPHGREDKEWIDVQASSPEEILKTFKGGPIVDIREDK